MKNIIGIDPGQCGGMAVISGDRTRIRTVQFKDLSEQEIYRAFSGETLDECQAYLEKVHSMPRQGVTSTFTFGKNYGFLRGVLVALGIPFEDVPPQTWQRKLGIAHSVGDYNARKKYLKSIASQWFPSLKVTHSDADALLIAEYAHRLNYRPSN